MPETNGEVLNMFPLSFKPVVAVVGSKNSGKTRIIEMLTKELSHKGYKVATVKHIPKYNFTIDREGTDTWRHAKAGARIVVSVAPEELAIIRRVNTANYELEQILMECEKDVDIIILEGFKRLIEKDTRIPKIITVKDAEEIHEASKRFSPILACVGSIASVGVEPVVNYINIAEEGEKLVHLILKKLEATQKRPNSSERIKVLIDGRSLVCKRFVEEILRKTVLAMISTLKGTSIKGDEEVHIMIKSAKQHS